VVIRGNNNPFVVLVTSSSAVACGVAVPIPTWEKILLLMANTKAVRVMICLIFMCERLDSKSYLSELVKKLTINSDTKIYFFLKTLLKKFLFPRKKIW
jgi:hypothetical protein